MRIDGSCATCSAPVTRVLSRNNAAKRRGQLLYCSRACRRTGTHETCAVCGQSFYLKRYQAVGSPDHWCSRECADIGRKKGQTAPCQTCGKMFYVYPSKQKLGGGMFCSQECYSPRRGVAMRGRPKSVEHCKAMSAAKRTQSGRNPYYGPRWHLIRREIRARDENTCRDCGLVQISPGLDVHHIVPRAAFGGDHEASNHPDNLVTLCKSCHAVRDNLLGRSRGVDFSTLPALAPQVDTP